MVNFMFREMDQGEQWTKKTMQQGVERFYRRLVTRIVRNPNGFWSHGKRPRLFGCPDAPVYKRQKPIGRQDLPNNGLHFNAILMLSPDAINASRLKKPLDEHVNSSLNIYCDSYTRIARIDLRRIEITPEKATKYVFKALTNHRISQDDLFCLPLSISEKSNRPSHQYLKARSSL